MQRRKFFTSQEDYEAKLAERLQTFDGAEMPDATPVAPPVGYKRQPTMVDIVRDMIRSEKLRQEVEAAGAETFEEADDFDVDDEMYPTSPYEFEDIFEPHPGATVRGDESSSAAPPQPAAASGSERPAEAADAGSAAQAASADTSASPAPRGS